MTDKKIIYFSVIGLKTLYQDLLKIMNDATTRHKSSTLYLIKARRMQKRNISDKNVDMAAFTHRILNSTNAMLCLILHTSCPCTGTKLSWRSSFILLVRCWCSFVAGRLLAAHCPWWPWYRHVINGILTNRTSMLFSPVQPNRGKVEGVSQHPCGWRWRSRWTPLPWSATGECINYWIFSYYNLMQQLTLNMEMSGTQHRLSFNLNLHI